MPIAFQTLAQFIHSLSPQELNRAAASLLQGRVLPDQDAADRLFQDLVSFPSIQRRLGLLPLPRAVEAIREAILAGGHLPLSRLDGCLASEPQALQDLLERYFLGTVGTPDWHPLQLGHGEPSLITFPEVTISYLRNATPELPRLFALLSPAEGFTQAMDILIEQSKGEGSQASSPECPKSFRDSISCLGVFPRDPAFSGAEFAGLLWAALSGEHAMERLAMLEHRPFRRWELLSDRERCSRLLLNLLASNCSGDAGNLLSRFARPLVQVARTLEAARWYPPDTLLHLLLLEELRAELEGVNPSSPAQSASRSPMRYEELVQILRSLFYPRLGYSGILETAVCGNKIVGERLTREGMAALSQRVDWQHGLRLRKAPESSAAELPGGDPYVTVPPGQSVEARIRRFLVDVRRLLLLLLNVSLEPTKRGRLSRSHLRQLRKTLPWPEEYAEFIFDFVIHAGLVEAPAGSNRYLPAPASARLLDGKPGCGREIAAYFWQASFDAGPISENLRELKQLFVWQFLGPAGPNRFARLDVFWDWLAAEPSQQKVARHWRRYVDEDLEVLHSITLWVARSLAWLGLAEASPSAEQTDRLRLSPWGRAWLLEHRLDSFPAVGTGSSLELQEEGLICAPWGLPFEVLAELAALTQLTSLEDSLCFRVDEGRLIEAGRRGLNPSNLIRLLERYAAPSPSFLEPIRRAQALLERVQWHPSAGFLKVENPDLALTIANLPEIRPLVEVISGNYLILKPGCDTRRLAAILNQHGFPICESTRPDGLQHTLGYSTPSSSSSTNSGTE